MITSNDNINDKHPKNDNINDNTKYVQMLAFFTFSNCYHFYVIIYPCTYFVLSFMLSFDVIIFHGQQMLSFICYHFPLYIFCVIFMLSFDVNINDNNLKIIPQK
jgi:hypothetical protein